MTINNDKFTIIMAQKCLTKAKLAELAGMSRQRVNIILNSKSVTPVAAGRIAKALGVDVTEIID